MAFEGPTWRAIASRAPVAKTSVRRAFKVTRSNSDFRSVMLDVVYEVNVSLESSTPRVACARW